METMVTGPSRSTRTELASVMARLPGCFPSVIPGRCEASNPESRDSGSGLSDHPGMTVSHCQLATRHPSIRLEIPLAGGVHHAGRQGRRRGVAVPAAGAALGVEIIAQRLLVETRLRLAGLVDVSGPKPRAVRRHHLVDQDNAAVLVAAEFEFCIGDDDALCAGDLFAERVDRTRHALEFMRYRLADDLAHARDRNVLVMAGLGLGRRAEDRGFEFCAFG